MDPIDDKARCIPILPSLDISETAAFYERQLGFAAEIFDGQGYLIVRRDEMEIHFWRTSERIHPENSSCYIRGGQTAALYEEYLARGVERLSDFAIRPWNMKEFYIHDPHGNLLKFGGCAEELG